MGARVAVKPPVAMTIAGSDSGGGAGIAADLKTFDAHGVWGTAAITAVTAQNTIGVSAFELLSPSLVAEQIAAVAGDIGIDAAKTGMLGSAELVRAVARAVRRHAVSPLVVDPVLISKHGDTLLADDAIEALRDELLPLATIVTPNLPEAAAIAGVDVISDRAGMVEAARRIAAFGPGCVLVKGGHLEGARSPDCLLVRGAEPSWLEGDRIPGRHTHGTGCVLSAAITAQLARGVDVRDACVAAKRFIEGAIARGVELGSGVGPVSPTSLDVTPGRT